MLIPGRKRVTDIANACFFMKKHVSSFERFLSEHKWSMHQVIASLISLLLSQLMDRLMVHSAFLLADGRITAATLTAVAYPPRKDYVRLTSGT